MGHMRFAVPCRDRLPESALGRIYLAGIDEVPWRVEVEWDDGPDCHAATAVLSVRRSEHESGNLFVPWVVPDRGELTLSTTSLMEREQAYNLPVELARGVLNRVRNRAADWAAAGLVIPDDFPARLRAAEATFVSAVIGPASPCEAAAKAEQTIALGLQAGDLLAAEFTRQALAIRHRQADRLSTMCGTVLDRQALSDAESAALLRAVNSAAVSFAWREIEPTAGRYEWEPYDRQVDWCCDHQLRLIGGPLLCNTRRFLPDWLHLWDEDFLQLQAYVRQFIRAVVERYGDRIHVWNCAARMNAPGALALSDEQALRLVVAAVEEVRQVDSTKPLVVSFDCPWAEYLAHSDCELSPLHFADTLVRADLGIKGIGIELNLGYWPGGTLPRDLLEISCQVDRWSMLGLPLIIYLSFPSGTDCNGKAANADFLPLANVPGGASASGQCEMVERLIPLLLANPIVQGLVWNQFRDADRPEFVHGGLIDASAAAKPALDELARIRHQHLT